MYNKPTAPQRDILLSAEEDVASCDFDMDCTDDSEGLTHSCQDVSMDIDMEGRSPWILPLRTLMDVATLFRKKNPFLIWTNAVTAFWPLVEK